jgi:hypothetical protein
MFQTTNQLFLVIYIDLLIYHIAENRFATTEAKASSLQGLDFLLGTIKPNHATAF